MSTISGTVAQNTVNGGSLLFTDTGSYGTIVSRTLTIYDYLGNALQVFNMGTNLTQIYTFLADAWFDFNLVVVDNTGTFTLDLPIVSQGFYWDSYTEIFNSTNCGCQVDDCTLEKSQRALAAALRFNLGSTGPNTPAAASANREVLAANIYVNMSAAIQLQ